MITEKISEISYNYPKQELKIKYKTGKIKIINMSKTEYEDMMKSGNFKSLDNV